MILGRLIGKGTGEKLLPAYAPPRAVRSTWTSAPAIGRVGAGMRAALAASGCLAAAARLAEGWPSCGARRRRLAGQAKNRARRLGEANY